MMSLEKYNQFVNDRQVSLDLCYGFNKTLTDCCCCKGSTTVRHAEFHDRLCRTCYIQFKRYGLTE